MESIVLLTYRAGAKPFDNIFIKIYNVLINSSSAFKCSAKAVLPASVA